MAYFSDLSAYRYVGAPQFNKYQTEAAVGWLDRNHEFDKRRPTEELLTRIWAYCKVSIGTTRGLHECDLCEPPKIVHAKKRQERLLLGGAEIRVFSAEGTIFAAPTLIYHYIHTHSYDPPIQFCRAVMDLTPPPAEEYFEKLKRFGLEWEETPEPPLNPKRFKAEKIDGQVRIVEVPYPLYLDES